MAGDTPDTQPPFPDGTLGRVAVMSMEAGRMYPVDVHYLSDPAQDYLKACLETVLQIHMKEPPGDILVFLTGSCFVEVAEVVWHGGVAGSRQKGRDSGAPRPGEAEAALRCDSLPEAGSQAGLMGGGWQAQTK